MLRNQSDKNQYLFIVIVVGKLIIQFFVQMQLQNQSPSDDQNQQIQTTQQQTYITDAQQFLNFCQKDKKIKVMDECNPIWNYVYLKDISLHKKGPLEDKIYSRVGRYYRNIRRGNTLCQIYHQNQINNAQQQYDLFFCRRGMKKFYDLEPEYLLVSSNLSTHHRLMKNRIFQDLERQLQQPKGKFHLYRLFKENGEHCQIGYVKQLNCWLFASKNVAILARNPQDLEENYHKQRFYWAKLVGEEFFRVLEAFSQEKQEQFKKDIDGFTLLGQHCGHEKHQHITKYQKVQIIFYGLVKNIGKDHCQSVEQCRQLLNKYNLKMSSCVQRKGLVDKNTIYANMYELLKEVAQGTMQKQGQGSVMYIVCQRDGQQRTVAMCKLKTCQYLIYRRLREMLKLNVSRKSTANTFQKFKHDVQLLIIHYFKPPKPIQFYYKLGEKAFEQAEKNNEISETYLRYKFVDFIAQFQEEEKQKQNVKSIAPGKPKRIILICLPRVSTTVQKYCKSKEIEVDYMYRPGKPASKTTVHILYMIPRLGPKLQQNTQLIIAQYNEKDLLNSIQQLETCKDLTKSHLITFVKSADKAKSVRMLNSKIQAFRQGCSKEKVSFTTVEPSEQNIINEIRKNIQLSSISNQNISNSSQTTRYVVLPMLIPGSGKSSFGQQILKSHHFDWKIIDTDKIRRDLMQNIQEVDLDSSQQTQQLFIQAKNQTLLQYKKQLAEQISSQSNKKKYLFIDRLFSPYNINQTIQEILKLSQSVKIIVVTQVYSPVKLNDFTYPFSTNYLFTCLRRCLQRQDHKTMQNNPYEVAKIVLKYYQMNANFNQKNILKLSHDKIHIVKFAFIQDDQSCHYVHQNLKKKLQQCLKLIQPGRLPKDSNCFIELVEQLYKYIQVKEQNSFKRYHQFRLDLQKQIESLK